MEKQPNTKKQHPKGRRVLLVALLALLVLLLGAAIAFFVYTANYSSAGLQTADVYAAPDLRIEKEKTYTSVQLWEETPTTGYIFYPGGKVDSDAYLLYLGDIAREGYYCAVLEMPFHLAFFGVNRADNVIADNPQIETWVVGGHSLGGVAASMWAGQHPDAAGIVFLASYPSADLSQSPLAALSVTASNDEVLAQDSFESAKAKLPPNTRFAVIEGGNHAGFGDYGVQKGDGEAALPQSEQRAQTVALTLALLQDAAA